MGDYGTENGQPVIVVLPPVIEAGNARYAYGPLYAAVESGVPVVIADLSATVFCDAAGMRGLLMLRERSAARDIRFRLVIPPGAPLRRVLELRGIDHLLPVYPSAGEAARPLVPAAQDPLPSLRAAAPTSTPLPALRTRTNAAWAMLVLLLRPYWLASACRPEGRA
jgi:anti-anti-sigma regulatory factor